MKRSFDIIFSLLGMILLFPLFILLGFLIKIRDGGPVIFSQKRIGRRGRVFFIYKFNSIKADPSAREGLFGKGDIRNSSKLGRFLRKTKINELPQLLNVLKGEMSIVGPRPEVEKWVNEYPERWATVLKVRPGITDEASLVFLNEEEILQNTDNPHEIYKKVILPRKLDLYEKYVKNCCMKNDILIILRTISMLMFRSHLIYGKDFRSAPQAAFSEVREQEQVLT